MAVRRQSGYVDPNGGAFRQPTLDGVTDPGQSSPYRNKPTNNAQDAGLNFQGGAVSIDRINYIPYGDVYERPTSARCAARGGGAPSPEPEPVVTPDVYIESELYPVFWSDNIAVNGFVIDGDLFPHADNLSLTNQILSGTLQTVLLEYSNWPPEDHNATNSLISGTVTVYTYTDYLNWPPEDHNAINSLTSGTNAIVLLQYTNWPDENIALTNQITGGTLA